MKQHHHRSAKNIAKNVQKSQNKKQKHRVAGGPAAAGGAASTTGHLNKWERACLQKQNKLARIRGTTGTVGSELAEDLKNLPAPRLVCFLALHDSANPLLLKRKCVELILSAGGAGAGGASSTSSTGGVGVVGPSSKKKDKKGGNKSNTASKSSCATGKNRLPGQSPQDADPETIRKNAAVPYKQVTMQLPAFCDLSNANSNLITLVDIPTRDPEHALHIARCCDVIVLCLGPRCSLEDKPFDAVGYETLTFLKAQGFPCVVGAYQGMTMEGAGGSYSGMEFLSAPSQVNDDLVEKLLLEGAKNGIAHHKVEALAPAGGNKGKNNSFFGAAASSAPPALIDLSMRPFLTSNSAQQSVVSGGAGQQVDQQMAGDSSNTSAGTIKDNTFAPLSTKQQQKQRKLLLRFFESEFPQGEKLFAADTEQEIQNLLRHISALALKEVSFRQDRGYLMVDGQEIVASGNDGVLQLEVRGYMRGTGVSISNCVHLTGIGDFKIQKLAHWRKEGAQNSVPVLGETSSGSSTSCLEPVLVAEAKHGAENSNLSRLQSGGDESSATSSFARLRPFDPLNTGAEQSGISKQELENGGVMDIEDGAAAGNSEMKIPDAAANTIPMSLLKHKGADGEDGMDDDDGASSRGGKASPGSDDALSVTSFDDLNEELFKNAEEHQRTKNVISFEERAREDMDFPDEVDIPDLPVTSRERFQRYRGLRSFKNSHWDAYEELPLEYSRIWEFDSFNAAEKAFKQMHCDAVKKVFVVERASSSSAAAAKEEREFSHIQPDGNYVSLLLQCNDKDGNIKKRLQSQLVLMTSSLAASAGAASGNNTIAAQAPLVLSSLFDCERKVSVIHCSINRTVSSACPEQLDLLNSSIKSKTALEFQCGFRKFVVTPLFSHAPKKTAGSEKYLFQRFLHAGTSAIASFYGPVILGNTPVLVFSRMGTGENKDEGISSLGADGVTGSSSPAAPAPMIDAGATNTQPLQHQSTALSSVCSATGTSKNSSVQPLIATGSVQCADPKRLILKRAVLTGYPFRVHKNKAVIRHMFFTPEDINWFKPVELQTKHGLRGNIKESLGTHGYMKCIFGDRMKQNDTVMCILYKRQFPKWFPQAWGSEKAADDEDCCEDV